MKFKFPSFPKSQPFDKKNNFMFFVAICFVFMVSVGMLLYSESLPKNDPMPQTKLNPKVFPPNPVLGTTTTFPILSAQAVLAVDEKSGVPLYEKNPDAPLLPASTTKIVTALVSLDFYNLDDVLIIGPGVKVEGQKMGLVVGEQIRAEDLLYGLLVYSANDAAVALAENYPGGYPAFIEAMNKKAKDLHMANSRFENPVGLDGNAQRSTARDLVRVTEVAMKDPVFAKIVGTKRIIVTDVTGSFKYDLKNLNILLGSVEGVNGVKTGWTESARENLVTSIERNGHTITIALLGSQDRFGETKELIDWIFASYNWEEVHFP